MIEAPGFKPSDRILATTTLSFDISVMEVFLPLVVGGSVAVVDRATAKDTNALVEAACSRLQEWYVSQFDRAALVAQ